MTVTPEILLRAFRASQPSRHNDMYAPDILERDPDLPLDDEEWPLCLDGVTVDGGVDFIALADAINALVAQ